MRLHRSPERATRNTDELRWGARAFALLLLATSCALGGAPQARAGAFDRVRSCVARFGKVHVVDPLVANFENHAYAFHDLDAPAGAGAFHLSMGRALGNGLSAQVYVVEDVRGLETGAAPDERLVVKMAHSLWFRPEPRALAMKNATLEREYETYHVLTEQMSQLWSDPIMQAKKDRWIEGRVPLCPIYRIVRSDRGVLLFKPMIHHGKSLAQIFREAGGRMENIPREMLESVGDIYDLAQALRRRVVVPSPGGRARPFTADLKPENYMWVDDPRYLATYGLRKPGFVFVELTHFPKSPRYTYDEANMPREEYQEIFRKYVEAAGRQ